MSTGIEWTDETWNPVVGCTKVSQGCKLCYAKTIHDVRHKAYLDGKKVAPQYAHPFETVQLKPERLGWPLSLRKPSRIFVNSVSDLFHEDVPDSFIMQVFEVMAKAERHTFQILTKRPERMLHWFTHYLDEACSGERPAEVWPLPNVWLGVSVENQEAADERIPLLRHVPAAVLWISAEPLLGPLDVRKHLWPVHPRWPSQYRSPEEAIAAGATVTYRPQELIGQDWAASLIRWVVTGGESGSSKQNPRPMHPDWARSLRDQCVSAKVPFLFKQWGVWAPGGIAGANIPSERESSRAPFHYFDDPPCKTWRVGKKRAGRELDGRTWDEYPAVAP